MGSAYYNEIDPYAAQWLRNLIRRGLIAQGEVDERSIEDVTPADLAGFTQCHFFAGIGVWSHALRQAGWGDDRPVWTGSCPCQPFSEAGSRNGFADERHLWPAFFHLIEQCRPVAVFGEQVEGAVKHGWLDLVQTDLEGIGYTTGAAGLCAAGVGAPHIRQRLYFVGAKALAHTTELRSNERSSTETLALQGVSAERAGLKEEPEFARELQGGSKGLCWDGCGLGDSIGTRLEGHTGHGDDEYQPERIGAATDRSVAAPGCTSGFWRDVTWLPFRDSKIRPVEPGTFPLVDGAATRVGPRGAAERLNIPAMVKGYGNAIVAPLATEFIKAYMACKPA